MKTHVLCIFSLREAELPIESTRLAVIVDGQQQAREVAHHFSCRTSDGQYVLVSTVWVNTQLLFARVVSFDEFITLMGDQTPRTLEE